ncbi:MAG: aldolase/citrate lyase family protein [Vicinamibacterales bacterium]
MRHVRLAAAAAAAAGLCLIAVGVLVSAQAPAIRHNRVIGLLEQKQPVFGLYAPSNRRPGGPGAPAAAPAPPARTPAELAREAAAYRLSDFVFDGSMEGDFDRAFPAFVDFAKGLMQAGVIARTPAVHLTHPMIVKAPEIAPDPKAAAANIARQLNQGVSGVMLVTVETAEEARQGIAAMRFVSKGGTRPEGDLGIAPAAWGLSEAEYRRKADVWPLNPDGELINWTIVESKRGLANLREIAAVPGIGVLWPGAGTLRRVFSTTSATGERVVDEAAWEQAIQQVLAACKANRLACGFPASAADIETRMAQGFNVFVMNWGDAGFTTVALGRRIGRRADSSR